MESMPESQRYLELIADLVVELEEMRQRLNGIERRIHMAMGPARKGPDKVTFVSPDGKSRVVKMRR